MLTGEIRSQIDSIWNDFWSGGVSNPLSVIEQITYLLFIKRLDELHTVEERKASTLKIPMERRIFPEGKDDRGCRDPSDFVELHEKLTRRTAGDFLHRVIAAVTVLTDNGIHFTTRAR